MFCLVPVPNVPVSIFPNINYQQQYSSGVSSTTGSPDKHSKTPDVKPFSAGGANISGLADIQSAVKIADISNNGAIYCQTVSLNDPATGELLVASNGASAIATEGVDATVSVVSPEGVILNSTVVNTGES